MKTKQVVALMMAATLTLTSGGVTALAGTPGAVNMQGLTGSAVQRNDGIMLMAAATQDPESTFTVTAEVKKQEKYTYGDTISVTATVKEKEGNTLNTSVPFTYELYADWGEEGKPIAQATTSAKNYVFQDVKLGKADADEQTLKVRVTAADASGLSRIYNEGTKNIKVAPKEIKSDEIPLEITPIEIGSETKTKSTVYANVAAELNADGSKVKEYGTWSLGTNNDDVVTGENDIELKVTSENYKIDGTEPNQECTIKAKVNVIQLVTDMSVKAAEGEGIDQTGVLLNKDVQKDAEGNTVDGTTKDKPYILVVGQNSNWKSGILQATLTPTVENKPSAPTDDTVTWTAKSDKISVKDNGDGTATVTAKAATADKEPAELVVTAEGGKKDADGNSTVSKSVYLKVVEGVDTTEIDMPDKLDDVEYSGKTTTRLSDYYRELLEELNKKADGKGEYVIADNSNNDAEISKVGEYKDVKLVFILKEGNYQTRTDGWDKTAWTGKDANSEDVNSDGNPTITRTYTVTVTPKVISSTTSIDEIVGKTVEGEYPYGTTLEDIVNPTEVTNYDVSWWKVDGGTTSQATADDLKKVLPYGDLTGYELRYALKDTVNSKLEEGAKTAFQPSVTIVDPTLDVKVEEDTTSSTTTKIGKKYYADNTSQIVLKATPEFKNGNDKTAGYYEMGAAKYEWYKDGKLIDVKEDTEFTIDSSQTGYQTLTFKADEKNAGIYTCKVVVSAKDETIKASWFKDELAKREDESDPLEVAFTSITITPVSIGESGATEREEVYASIPKGVEVSASIKANDMQSYRIFYRKVTDGKDEGEEVNIANVSVAGDDTYALKENLVKAEIPTELDAGVYHFYVEVIAAEDSAVSKAVTLTVTPKEIDAEKLASDKLSKGEIVYGDTLGEVELTYDGEEKDALAFTLDEKTVPNAGEGQKFPVTVQAKNDNYTLAGTPELTAVVDVAKAPLTVKAADVSMTEGGTAALKAEVTGLVNEDKEADVVEVGKPVVLDAQGNTVEDTSKLAAGTYKIQANAKLLGEAPNYELKTEDGTLTVTAKTQSGGEEQKPGNEPGGNTPGGEGQNPGGDTPSTEVPATAITLDQTAVTLNVGETATVKAALTPANATETVTWETSDAKVATVAGADKTATITAAGSGTATITAKTAGGKSATVTVTVNEKTTGINVKSVSITLGGQKLSGKVKAKVKATYQLKAVVTPENASAENAKVTWKSSNTKVATVTGKGKVTVKKAGTAKITVTTADGKSASVTLNAKKANVKATKVTIKGSKTMKVKKSQKLVATIKPATVTNNKLTWTSSNTEVATVNKNGKVTAKKKGTVTITATTKDGSGKKATFKIKVK